ncbi:flagellar basal body-associated FliL family protein [Mesobacterium sp. TK19101]|uniref:Flagellar protein FliL n=1 Tax=Mesobacterium hydrothermale TaxID=3111907 RepID=A0ABU6HGX0_9RHOB|nr:flagellar basal body-associated FliL family protein [Mesobacterium sp. TK19101]MEC3861566.1 flagellar basal body-associated FliL family protein [Mesobacterium sp. TK19101]
MAEDIEDSAKAPRKRGKLPLVIGVVLALAGGGGAFFAVWSGMVLGGDHPNVEVEPHAKGEVADDRAADMAFVPVSPLIVALGDRAGSRHLRFAANLEVPSRYVQEVTHLMPRIVDALNSFLQAVEERDVADRDSLLRLRVQMLHRVRLVVGDDRVSDLLVSEFVLN